LAALLVPGIDKQSEEEEEHDNIRHLIYLPNRSSFPAPPLFLRLLPLPLLLLRPYHPPTSQAVYLFSACPVPFARVGGPVPLVYCWRSRVKQGLAVTDSLTRGGWNGGHGWTGKADYGLTDGGDAIAGHRSFFLMPGRRAEQYEQYDHVLYMNMTRHDTARRDMVRVCHYWTCEKGRQLGS
jgi:hypothetical protein